MIKKWETFAKDEEIKYHFDEVTSIFEEYVDEYDLDRVLDSSIDYLKKGIYYNILDYSKDSRKFSNVRKIQFQLKLFYAEEGLDNYFIYHSNEMIEKYYNLLTKSIPIFVDKLRGMEYNVGYDAPKIIDGMKKSYTVYISIIDELHIS